MFCLIIRILRLCLFLCYQVKMEGRLISQHSLMQDASCNYATSLHQEIDHCKREGEETIQYQ
jgi:hypothetical protein